jgi:phage terminase large subunit-like protein
MIGTFRPTSLSLGEEIIRWIESTSRVPEGALVGHPIQLMDWQRDAIRRTYDNPHGTRRCIISVGRKSGKITFAACLLLVHLVGPAAIPNSQLFSAAQSRDQAAILYALAAKIVRMSPRLSDAVVCKDGIKQLVCPAKGTTYRALSSEASTNYGLSPAFIVFDELGQVRGPRDPLFEALTTSTAGQLAPLQIIISTRATTDADLLSVLIDDALAGHDPRVICSLYTAPATADPFDIETIKAANPSIGVFQNPDAPLDLTGRDVFCGLDLSETTDLTALVLVGAESRVKRRSTGRIDGMIALTMALGVAPLRTAVKFDVEALIA